MKQYFTLLFTKKIIRLLLLTLSLLVAMPIIDAPNAEAQTKRTGNFFTRKFKRKNKFHRKAKNSTAFQRKPYKCSEVGKQKVRQLRVSKKQLERWEEERLVKAEREKRNKANQVQTQDLVLSASSKNSIEVVATSPKSEKETTTVEEKKEKEPVGWYSSEKPETPTISPVLLSQNGKITDRKSKKELETAAKYSKLGYDIVLESNDDQHMQIIKNYLISIGAESESIKTNLSETANTNEVSIKIEK